VETRALIASQGRSRALVAAGLLAILLAALLGAWFVSGWHDVRMRQAEMRQAPITRAASRATELARELQSELDGLLSREVRRPYFHYQNLMHDPRSRGLGVTPSPLAQSPDDQLVAGYFQIDSKGRTSTPTINDEVPELSDQDDIAVNGAFRDQVVRDFAFQVIPPPTTTPTIVAQAPSPPTPSRPRPSQPDVQQQVIQIDSSSYSQNMSSNQVWQSSSIPSLADVPSVASTLSDPNPTVANIKPQPQPRTVKPVAPAPAKPQPVTITVSPLEWRTLPFSGAPALVAVRSVQTPDGNLSQGFVVDRATLTSELATKAGDMVAELHASSDLSAPQIAPGWQLTVVPNPRVIASAAASSIDIARSFVIRFVLVGTVAAVTALLVLLLVLRAEKLARERSQFAAAAAHELRTPLAGLPLYGDMLADGLGDPGKLKDYARRMSEEAARLGRVVSNVLGFSQLERGNLSVKAEVGALGDALRELGERVEPALDRAGAVLELDVSPQLRARFDRDALTRIVGNLLDNAEKYSRGVDDRTISLVARDRGDVVEIVVGDRGPGIADKTRLFRPFSRGVASDGPAGLGLGLALSRSLAQAMGGELSYRPRAEGGAELVLALPRA
jgi:signal transduction histidine kinase